MSKNYNSKTRFIALAFAAVLVVIDQLIKLRVLEALPRVGRKEIVRGFFYLTYVENRGAAFGIFQGKTGMLSVLTGAVLAVILVLLLSDRVKNGPVVWSLSLILAGGVGNLVDRIYRGFVVDYLDFSALFGFPVFNFADCCVVVGTVLLLCLIAWSDRAGAGSGEPPAVETGGSEV